MRGGDLHYKFPLLLNHAFHVSFEYVVPHLQEHGLHSFILMIRWSVGVNTHS